MTVMGCVTNPAAHPTYHLDYLTIEVRRLEEGVGKRERHSDVALLSRTFISRRIHSRRLASV